MMNQKIVSMNDVEKKQVALTGFLSLPLRVGERAFIYHGGQTIATSPVNQILEVSEDGVIFETLNTLYTLVYTTIPLKNEVMCA